MKKRLTSPTFDASAQTVTHSSFSDVTLAGIQLIVNVTDQIIIYNFADTAKGGTLSTDTLTLEYDTTSMSDTDELMVLVEDGSATQAVSGTVTAELSAVDNAVLDTIAAKDFATQTTLAAINTKLVGGTVIGDVNLGATDNAVLDAIEADTTTIAGDTTSIDGKLPALGQALAAASVPVVLPAAQITTLTPPAAITGFATSANQTTIIGHVDGIETVLGTIDADTGAIKTAVEAIQAAQLPDGHNVTIDNPGDIGGGVQYTEGDTDATITGTAAMVEGAANALAVMTQPLTDTQLRATAVPVSGTVTANLSATDNAVLDAIVVDTGEIQTAVESIDSGIAALATEATIATMQGDTSDIATNTGDILTSTGATTDAAVTAGAEGSIQAKLRLLTSQLDAVKTAVEALDNTVSGSELQVDVLTMPTTAVTGTFWQATQPVSGTVTANLSATDNTVLDNIDTDLTTIIGHVDGLEGLLTTIDADTGGILTAVQTLDNAISGSEMQVDVVAALPAGTNAIGKMLPPDIDVTAHTNYVRKYYTSATPTDGIIWSPVAGKRWHVVTMYINVSAASTVTLEDDKAGGDDPVWKGEIAANSGVVLHFPEKYPMASGEDEADLTITATAGTVYVTCVGYEI